PERGRRRSPDATSRRRRRPSGGRRDDLGLRGETRARGGIRDGGADRDGGRSARPRAGVRRRCSRRLRRRGGRREPRARREVPRRQGSRDRGPGRPGQGEDRWRRQREGGAGAPARASARVGHEVGSSPRAPKRVPIWRLALLGVVRAFQGAVIFPLRRMWRSSDPIDAYGLNHLTSVAGDALLAISLSDSVFFSVPVGEARIRVAAYLALTMLPLAVAGPLIVPILDRAGPRRSVTFGAALGRSLLAIVLAPRLSTTLIFPLALAMLVLSKIHGIVKNGLTMAYASKEEGLMRANARLGRIAVAGAIGAAPIGFLMLKTLGGAGPIYTASVVYGLSALFTLRLPHPGALASPPVRRDVALHGRIPQLALPAMGAVGIRAAGGFLLFLMAFALRSAAVQPWGFA